jgi:DNA-binding NarL/FixJ family response regulator
MPHSEIAAKLGASESTVKRQLNSALAKLEAAGQLESFLAIAQHAQAIREMGIEGVRIPCGSIECRPDKWVY